MTERETTPAAQRKKRRTPRCKATTPLEVWPWKTRCYEGPGHEPPHVSAHGVRWVEVTEDTP